jgi:transposase InsO family protein
LPRRSTPDAAPGPRTQVWPSRDSSRKTFLDDCSRFVVAWGLQLHQRQELVTECLLEGIQRFGKPREVLTDQGRQYYSWRGKSEFDVLMERDGIRHVVSRPHNPETLGKC